MTAVKITPARKRALQALHAAGTPLRISNETNDACVYWQTAAWLQDEGLAVTTWSSSGTQLQLTDAGRHIASGLSS